MARIHEQRLGDLPWLVATGERTEAFRLLGAHEAAKIRKLTDGSMTVDELRRDARVPRVAEHLGVVTELTKAAYPDGWAELSAMADGAGVDVDDLALINLRGDYGIEDGAGCSDLAIVHADRAVIGHNEDGPPDLVGDGALLTLALDGEPTVTVWWHPGFLSANTFVINEYGVAWGIDNIRLRTPAVAPGRHFVGRALQRCRTTREAAAHLRDNPSAGGFAYTIGQVGTAAATQVEVAAGKYAEAELTPGERRLEWHTNHLRRLSSELDCPLQNSHDRATAASRWTVPERDALSDWCLSVLAEQPAPDGVRRDARHGDPLVTLITFVVDLSAGLVTVAPRDGRVTTIRATALARGVSTT